MQTITILGATGSIGVNTLDVIARHPDRYRVHALSCRERVELLAEQCQRFQPQRAVVGRAEDAARLKGLLGQTNIQIDHGSESLCEVAQEADTVMAAIVGAAGLPPVIAAARAGRRILLANKEALVMGGGLFMDEVHRHHATLLPIDSEHNAIFQCLPHDASRVGPFHGGVKKLILTASGGPFRKLPLEQMADVTPEQACAHPNWVMGRKISVDSATMMNKGLEVIEAHWLFGVAAEQIEVLIHPQSVIHSMVSYVDGSVIAQLGNPDMRTPIAHALAYPERIDAGVSMLDLVKVGRLDFELPDWNRFPCLKLAYTVLNAGGTAPAILNAANEIAVEAFLMRRISFATIPRMIEQTLNQIDITTPSSLEEILEADAMARAITSRAIAVMENTV